MRILVPLDSSTWSQAAQRVALQLAAARPGVHLHAMHVVNVRTASGNIISDIPGYAGFEPAIVSPQAYEAHESAAQAMVDQFVKRALAEGASVDGSVAHGAVTAEIVKAADSAGLVVMGMKGESEDRYPGQGGAQASNALPLLDTPTLLVPRTVTRIQSIAVGYDGSAGARHALRSASALAELGFPLHLIHVGAVGDEDPLIEAEGFLSADLQERTHRHYVTGDSVHEALQDAAAEANANVLALGFRGADPLKNALFGSSREYLLGASATVALLITR